MMNKSRDILLVLVLFSLAFLAIGCMHATSKAHPAKLVPGEEMRVEGTLGQQEFGCLTVRTADGRRFNIARDLEGSRPGQVVWIEGYVVKTKGCMPGPTLMPRQAGLLQGNQIAEEAKGQVTGR